MWHLYNLAPQFYSFVFCNIEIHAGDKNGISSFQQYFRGLDAATFDPKNCVK
jgi:hypothetical protein